MPMMPQPLATPIQKKKRTGSVCAAAAARAVAASRTAAAAAADKKATAKAAPKLPPYEQRRLEYLTRTASLALGRDASIEDLIACTLLLHFGPRNHRNHMFGAGSRNRKAVATWLFHQHIAARANGERALGYLDGLKLQQNVIDAFAWEAGAERFRGLPKPEPWVSVGRDCGHGSNSLWAGATDDCLRREWLTLENLHEWKRDLPLYLRAGQQAAYAHLRRCTTIRRAWTLLRRHARAVDLAARVALYWQERTQMALCAPDGAGRAADCAAFAADF